MADSRSESMSTVYELSEDIVHRNVEKSNVSSSTPSNIDRLSASFEPAYFNIETDEQSPYEEVAANVSNKDDRDMPCLTLRSWIISLLFTCLLSFVNQFFWYRTSPLFVGVIVAQLLSHLLGKIMAKVLPRRTFKVWRWGFCLNPGPFTIKEHCIITAMASAAGGTAYAIDVITIKRLFYKRSINYGVGILFVITSQTLGYGMAGIMRRFLVWPAAMIWPANLISCALFRTLHSGNDDNMQEENNNSRWTMSRFRFFFLAFLCQFLWYWFPGYIFPILSLFSWICVIKPDNILLSQLTGVNGLGLGSLELDWNAWVSFLGSPIIVPFWAQINIMIGFVILAWIMTPAAYYTNLWGAKAFPMVSTRVFTEDGYYYNIKSVLNSQNRLNETAYNTYGEMRMTVIFAFSYGASFAAIAAVIVHTILFNVAVASAFLLLLPTGIVLAVSNQGIGLNVIAEFIAGVAIPGDPLVNVTFKTYGYITQAQALTLISDLKLGHYTKIPPRAMFITQLVGTIIAGIINYATADCLMTTIPNICTERNLRWTCPNANTFYSASIIWGAIGPVKMFGKGSTYSSLLYAFLIGAFLPIPVWFLLRKFPNAAWLKHVHVPIMLSATAMMPPAPPGNYPSWLFVGFFFNFVLVRYAHSWWKRYAYVFSAAMDCGVAICGLVIFFALQHNEIEFPTWWGTGGDTGDGCPLSHANYSGILPSSRSTVSD
ncbi:unnamed protein product [Rotaria socialis]|uniref:Oligopeptide transporter n=1 Tax=Rotaria socialis TaxID=392032 RepID=A0A820VG50_9BILA|nr:unnamed protein product [Rotaria socialis]